MQKGFRLTFHSEPPLKRKPPKHLRPNKAVSNRLRKIIPDLLSANIIREVFEPFPKLFHSRIFTRPKKDGTYRPIIDLSELNKYLIVPRFKMETVSITKNCLCVPLWGCKADINQAFHNVPIFYNHQVYIAFSIGKGKKLRIFVFQFLPFSLSSAPWAFHRIIKPIKKHLRDLMICVVSYLDDFAFFASTKTGMRQAIREFKALLKRLNLSINMSKSDFTPKRSIEYLGVQFNLKPLSLSLPESKILSVQSESKSLMTRHACSRRDLESLIGLLNFVAEYIRLGRLRLLPLIRWMNHHTSPSSRSPRLNRRHAENIPRGLDIETLPLHVHPHAPSPPDHGAHDRCLHEGLVWGSLASQNTRALARLSLLETYQLAGIKSSPFITASLPTYSPRSNSPFVDRQQHSPVVSLEPGLQNPRPHDPNKGNLRALRLPRHLSNHTSPPRSPQRPCRCGFEATCDRHRMDARQDLVREDSQSSEHLSPSRPVCHQGQQANGEFCVSLPRPIRGGQRRISPRLEQVGVDLPVSPTSSSSGMSRQTRFLRRYRSSRNRQNSLPCGWSFHSHGTQTEMQVGPQSPSGGP